MSKRPETEKSQRVLHIMLQLMGGGTVGKADLMQQLGASERNIQDDVRSINQAFAEMHLFQGVFYDRKRKGYYMGTRLSNTLTNSEILAVSKILLESRSMRKDEMSPILDKLISCCVPEQNKKAVQMLIANEEYHYIEPHHGKHILGGLWEIGQAIQNRQVMEIHYERLKEPKLVSRRIEPVGIMFSEYYFYLTAFLQDVNRNTEFENADDLFPTIYRIDRIQSFRVLDEHFHVPYKDRFEEGEFRKRIQFMYGGKLETIQFRYKGPSLEAVQDRIPTARVIRSDSEGWIISAEVFGKGIGMWLRSQGNQVQVLAPEPLAEVYK